MFSQTKAGTHSAFGEGSHTRAHTPKQGPSLPRPQRGFVLPAKFLLFRHAFIYIHFPVLCAPHYISRGRKSGKATAINFIPKPLFNFLHKRPTFAFTGESGYALGSSQRIAHNGTHAETWAFRLGVLSLPLERFARFGNPAWPGVRTANIAAFAP